MVKVCFNSHAVGFAQLGTVQVEVTDWEGDTLAAELTIQEAVDLANTLARAFNQANKNAAKAIKKLKGKRG